VLVAFSLVLASGANAEPASPLQRSHLVILGGGKTPAEAEAVVKGFAKPQWLTLATGYPRVIESATVKGLNPGFFIAVAGACASKRAAEEARDLLGFLSSSGVYLREVQVPEALLQDCPSLQPMALGGEFDPTSFRVVQKAPLDAARPTLTWVIRKKRPKGGCDTYDVALQAGDTLLAHQSFEETGCRAPLGRHRSRYALSFVEVAGARFVRVNASAEWHDNASRNDTLMDFACGALTEVAELSSVHDFVEELSPVEGRSPREGLRMRWHHEPCLNCRPDNEVLVYERSAECRYTQKPATEG